MPSPDGGDGGDGGNRYPDGAIPGPRNARINVNCTSAAGEEGAEDCNARLGLRQMGASFFIGPRPACYPDPNHPACQSLCPLSDMNPENCTFATPAPGCAFNASEGYTVVVQAGSKRWYAAVGAGDSCPAASDGSRRAWARVSFEDLEAAAVCARSIPEGGFGPVRYGSCDTPEQPCGDPGWMPRDNCQTLMFMAGMSSYEANVCTHNCNGDADCGGRGRCVQGVCFNACGGPCALSCQDGFTCNVPMGATMGFCLPRPPQ